jgi:hypothetical protein
MKAEDREGGHQVGESTRPNRIYRMWSNADARWQGRLMNDASN